MDPQNVKNKLKLLVAYNVGEVLTLLLSALRNANKQVNEAIIHLSRYNDLNRDARLERMQRNEVAAEMNRLRLAIMGFIDDAEPADLDLAYISEALIGQERFNEIIEKKVIDLDFRGIFENETLQSEYLDFNWKKFFSTNAAGELFHLDDLISAIHLLQAKFELPLWQFTGEQSPDLWGGLLPVVEQLRELPVNEREQWEVSVQEARAALPKDAEPLLACLHETIEVLLDK